MGLLANSRSAQLRDNTMRFGSFTSVPQGYQSAYRAITPTIKESSAISVRITGTGDLTNLQSRIAQSLGATITGEGIFNPNTQVGKTMSATITGSGNLAAHARMNVSMSVRLDAGSRPSAFDIAQEVWQSQKTSYNSVGTMGNALNNAASGGVDYAALGEAVWAILLADANNAGSMGELVQSITGGGSAPTAAEIADAVWNRTLP